MSVQDKLAVAVHSTVSTSTYHVEHGHPRTVQAAAASLQTQHNQLREPPSGQCNSSIDSRAERWSHELLIGLNMNALRAASYVCCVNTRGS